MRLLHPPFFVPFGASCSPPGERTVGLLSPQSSSYCFASAREPQGKDLARASPWSKDANETSSAVCDTSYPNSENIVITG